MELTPRDIEEMVMKELKVLLDMDADPATARAVTNMAAAAMFIKSAVRDEPQELINRILRDADRRLQMAILERVKTVSPDDHEALHYLGSIAAVTGGM